jgi:hypothetical protein
MTAKLIELNPAKAVSRQADFFATYGANTGSTYAQFLDQVYQSYVKTQAYQYLGFREKVNVEYQYQSLRRFVLQLQQKQ